MGFIRTDCVHDIGPCSADGFRRTPTAAELQACAREPEPPAATGPPAEGKLPDDKGRSAFAATGNYAVTMDLKGGNNDTRIELHENGVLIHSAAAARSVSGRPAGFD